MMHAPVYLAICATAVGSLLLVGTPDLSSMVLAAALAIAVLGVPHGGLDHWTGRRILRERFQRGWWAVFFPAYLLVGLLFAAGWFTIPTVTVVVFLLVSAWHFGREDQQMNDLRPGAPATGQFSQHVNAASVGGLVIWIPALVRPDEMRSLLRVIVPSDHVGPANQIVGVTQCIAAACLPLAAAVVVAALIKSPSVCERWVPLATAAVAIFTPILISFSIYFCVWHSWQGLQRLRRDESLTVAEFVRSVAPLSSAAILGVVAAGWWMQGGAVQSLLSGQATAPLRTVFIGLSAIAVPHLFLHEFGSVVGRSSSQREVCS